MRKRRREENERSQSPSQSAVLRELFLVDRPALNPTEKSQDLPTRRFLDWIGGIILVFSGHSPHALKANISSNLNMDE